MREHRKVGEGGPAPLHAVGLGSPVGDEVAAHLSARTFHARVAFALGDAHLAHRLDAGAGGHRPLRQPVERLPHDVDRLAELDHPHPVAGVTVARRLHRHLEVEVLVGGIGLEAPDVVAHPGAADQRAGDADGLGQLARDRAHALGARLEEGVPLEHVLVLVEALLDQRDRLAALLGPAGRNVVAGAAHLMEPVEQPRPDQRLEEVEHPLALPDAVEEHGGAAAQRAAHVEAPGAEPEAVRRDALQLGHDHPQVLGAPRHLDLPDHLGRAHVGQLARHGGHVVGLGRDRGVLRVGERLAELLVTAVEIADHRVHPHHRLALEGEDRAEDAVGGRVLRPHVHREALAAPVAQLDDFPCFWVHVKRASALARRGRG